MFVFIHSKADSWCAFGDVMEIAEHIAEDLVGKDPEGCVRISKSTKAWRLPQVIEVPVGESASGPDRRSKGQKQKCVRKGYSYYYNYVFEKDELQIWAGFLKQAEALYDRQRRSSTASIPKPTTLRT